ncbi:MAG: sulfotransferase [Reichenbachiella sp.]|uniref:sulfotransferase n=1 Tax=Reichenbachiella sp. TaxID=2184521 RepID=UPI0032636392
MVPDFLCIGAQKAGTSWLQYHLREHPQIWLPPFKEIHYFDDLDRSSHLRNLILRRGQYLRSLHKLGQIPLERGLIRDLFWFMKYFVMPRTNRWYQSLFQPKAGQIAGELTPAYARLTPELISEVYKFNPELKLIYVLRNPIDRTISQLKMQMSRKSVFDEDRDLPDKERLEAYMKIPQLFANGDYLTNLSNWQTVFPENQILVLFFEEMSASPTEYLKKILDFLEVNSSFRFDGSDLSTKMNGYDYLIPDEVVRRVNIHWHDKIIEMHTQFNNKYTAQWLEDVNMSLANTSQNNNER